MDRTRESVTRKSRAVGVGALCELRLGHVLFMTITTSGVNATSLATFTPLLIFDQLHAALQYNDSYRKHCSRKYSLLREKEHRPQIDPGRPSSLV